MTFIPHNSVTLIIYLYFGIRGAKYVLAGFGDHIEFCHEYLRIAAATAQLHIRGPYQAYVHRRKPVSSLMLKSVVADIRMLWSISPRFDDLWVDGIRKNFVGEADRRIGPFRSRNVIV